MSRTIAFVVHPGRRDADRVAARMERQFRQEGLRVFYPRNGSGEESCELVMTFGGDGTLLAGARTALEYRCPLLGINLGTMGFLTEGDPKESDRIFRAVMDRNYVLESRGMLRIRVNDGPESFPALNDAVVTRGGFARLIQVEVLVNGEHWDTFVADGVLAATPTGSTGYSLSAGGPVIAPGVECAIITPVCAHSLRHSPCIVPSHAEILFHLCAGRDQLAQLQIDGQNLCTLQAGDTVRITGAEEALQLARIGEYRFFTVLRSKLNEWSSPREKEES